MTETVDAKQTDASQPRVTLRYIGDGSTYQSGVPLRDVTTDDDLSDELAELAVTTGTHTRI